MVNELNSVSEVEITYRPKFKASERPQISSSDQAFQLLRRQWNSDKIELVEEFKIVLLNRQNRVLGVADISTGGVSATVVDPKIIFATALKANASALILAHNHPSGSLKASYADIAQTEKLKKGALLLEMTIWDHIILTNDGFLSFADEGLL
ncbi:JAB domain-containing protein [Pedobacter namyangjuensis]|uniref:JAB domain-containing protein n=1 Tax=Pedobacter namyangjuensis TaxID=600626 RepID=UPI000DE24C92|nr:JAB domain-containing protein [Pedobacter namyangjuensis]